MKLDLVSLARLAGLRAVRVTILRLPFTRFKVFSTQLFYSAKAGSKTGLAVRLAWLQHQKLLIIVGQYLYPLLTKRSSLLELFKGRVAE